MFSKDPWQEIFFSIKQNKLRTFLSGVTIALGIFIFIVLFGIGNGLQNGFTNQFIRGNNNLISFYPGVTSEAYRGLQESRNIVLKNSDLEAIRKQYNNKLENETAVYSETKNVIFNSESGKYEIHGVFPEQKFIEKIKVKSGKFISKLDIENKTKFASIGRLVENDLFKNKSALGNFINIDGINYKVIGTFSNEDGDNQERIIYIPITSIQFIKQNSDTLSEINLSYPINTPPEQAIKLGNEIEQLLRSRLKVSPTDNSGLYVRNTAENMKDTFAFLAVITFLVLFIGFGTIMAGIIGISNIMVYIVKERTKEIGIRKALGAKPFSIVSLILQESIFVTVISGWVGALLGVLFLNSINDKLEDYFIVNPSVSPKLIIIASLALIIAGIIAGFVPARKASKVSPIEALRTD